jgi:DNA polymerase-1
MNMQELSKFDGAEVLALDFETENKYNMKIFSIAGKVNGKIISGAYSANNFPEFWGKNKNKKFIFHNSAFDLSVLKNENYNYEEVDFEDTIIMSHLIDETARKGLKDLRVNILNKSDRMGWKEIDKSNTQEYLKYAEEDAIDTYQLYEVFKKSIIAEELDVVYKLEKEVVYSVIDMQYYGIKVDRELLKKQEQMLNSFLLDLKKNIDLIVGYEINLNSSKQLQELFFTTLKFPPLSEWKNKSGYSVDEKVLNYLSNNNDIPKVTKIAEKMLEHRKYSKILSTYVVNILKKMNDAGYIFPSFNALGTNTGRFSSSAPNMQNIPAKPFIPGNIDTNSRSIFICEEDEYLLTADYSQIELRFTAELSKDENMYSAFLKGMDIHKTTSELLNIDRRSAKIINFGIIYGMMAGTLAHKLTVDWRNAQDYINNYWKKYSGVESFFNFITREVKRLGYVRTISGRKRRFFGQNDKVMARQAGNTSIQGSSADLIKAAMVKVRKEIDRKKARLAMQVHDELTYIIKKDYAEEAMEIVKYCMENVIDFSLPILVDMKIGNKWSENK